MLPPWRLKLRWTRQPESYGQSGCVPLAHVFPRRCAAYFQVLSMFTIDVAMLPAESLMFVRYMICLLPLFIIHLPPLGRRLKPLRRLTTCICQPSHRRRAYGGAGQLLQLHRFNATDSATTPAAAVIKKRHGLCSSIKPAPS